jgi:penicillin-binding protein 2
MGGPDPVAAVATKMGLGQIFDIGIDGQHAGLVPTTKWRHDYFVKRNPRDTKWIAGETPTFGIGQGYTNVSALQNCVMVSRLANGKKAVNPILIKSINGVDKVAEAKVDDLPFNPDHIAFVHQAMADVVLSGTAALTADMGLGPVKMAGKTGTAQSIGANGGRTAHGAVGQWDRRDHAWFVAFAPADAPKYAIAVIVQHGGFGAAAAAPKAREIMRTALLKDPEIQKRIVGTNVLAAPPPIDPNDTTGAAPPPPDEISTPSANSSAAAPKT